MPQGIHQASSLSTAKHGAAFEKTSRDNSQSFGDEADASPAKRPKQHIVSPPMKRRGAEGHRGRSKPAVVQGEIWRETPPLKLPGVQPVALERQIQEQRVSRARGHSYFVG
jgi:hypothetical protein